MDMCDYCGTARGMVQLNFSAGPLFFCRHCLVTHAKGMNPISYKVSEDAKKIYLTPDIVHSLLTGK